MSHPVKMPFAEKIEKFFLRKNRGKVHSLKIVVLNGNAIRSIWCLFKEHTPAIPDHAGVGQVEQIMHILFISKESLVWDRDGEIAYLDLTSRCCELEADRAVFFLLIGTG